MAYTGVREVFPWVVVRDFRARSRRREDDKKATPYLMGSVQEEAQERKGGGRMTKITEEWFDNCDLVEIHNMGDNVDPLYGMTATEITEEQLEELKKGKVAYSDDGEYAHIVRMRRGGDEVDIEELVRCKDCRWYDKGENVAVSWEFCVLYKHNTRDDGYCYRGERKEK